MGYFSDNFLKKYTGNADMQEVVKNAYQYIEPIQASQADKETLYEALYAFKMTIAEEAHIDMDNIYKKLGVLSSINETPRSEMPERTAGLCSFYGSEDPARPCRIDLTSESVARSDDYRKNVLIHEALHVLSSEYVLTPDGSLRTTTTGLNGTSIDEAVTDSTATRLTEYLGYYVPHNNAFLTMEENGSSYTTAYTGAHASGYTKTAEYTKLLETAYGPEDLYSDKFLGTKRMSENHIDVSYQEVRDILGRIGTGQNSLEDHVRLQSILLDKVHREWQTNPDYGLSDYMADSQDFISTGVKLIGESKTIQTIDAYQTPFEITQIYASRESLTHEEIIRELDPATRSDECYNFLMAFEALKRMDKTFTDEELWNMDVKRVKINGVPALNISIGEETYYATCGIHKTTGLTECGFIMGENPSSLTFAAFKDAASAISQTRASEVDILFTEMAETNKYSNIYTTIAQTMSVDEISQNPGRFLVAAAAADESVASPKQLFSAYSICDISQIQDANGNNLFHILAQNDSQHAGNMLMMAHKANPELVGLLMNTPNNDGVTPADIIHSNGNARLMYAMHALDIPDSSTLIVKGTTYDKVNDVYVPMVQHNYAKNHPEFLQYLVEHGANINATDTNGNTLVHHFVGATGNISLQYLMNNGADIDALNKDGKTPLSTSMETYLYDPQTTNMLLNFGANPNVMTSNGTALNQVLSYSSVRLLANTDTPTYKTYSELVDKLLEHGANPNIQDYSKPITPLQIAAGMAGSSPELSKVDYEMIDKLIRAGADPLMETRGFPSLRDYAAETGDTKLFAVMLNAGIDRELLDIEHANLSLRDQIMLMQIDRTVDIALTENIRAHQQILNSEKTADLDVNIEQDAPSKSEQDHDKGNDNINDDGFGVND